MGRKPDLAQSCERVGLYTPWRIQDEDARGFFKSNRLTVESIVRGIVPRHDFDHEGFNSLQHSSLIRGRVHFEDVGWPVDAMVLLTYTYVWRD